MGSLADGLLKKGLISEEAFKKNDQQEQQKRGSEEARSLKKLGKDALSPVVLEGCLTVTDFKFVAKQILLNDSSLISEVIKRAQPLRNHDGGKRLLWLLYQLRDNLKDHKADQEQLISRALRKADSTVKGPDNLKQWEG